MGSILVRDLDQKIIERLTERARLNGRSLQQEVKVLLERAAETLTMREARRLTMSSRCFILRRYLGGMRSFLVMVPPCGVIPPPRTGAVAVGVTPDGGDVAAIYVISNAEKLCPSEICNRLTAPGRHRALLDNLSPLPEDTALSSNARRCPLAPRDLTACLRSRTCSKTLHSS